MHFQPCVGGFIVPLRSLRVYSTLYFTDKLCTASQRMEAAYLSQWTNPQEELKCRFWLVMEIVIGSGLRCDWVSLSHQSPIDVRLESQSCVSSVYWFVCYTHDSLPLVFYWLSTAKIDCWQRVHVWLWMMLFTLNCEQTYLNLNSPANVRMNSNKLSCFFIWLRS